MSEKADTHKKAGSPQAEAKKLRLKAALKANMAKRKAQARARKEAISQETEPKEA